MANKEELLGSVFALLTNYIPSMSECEQAARRIVEKIIEQETAKAIEETSKAYGGCSNCYGKGFSSVNDMWSGIDTDTDIGSPGGTVSGGDSNAMKFCKCERGNDLKKRFIKADRKVRIDELKSHGGQWEAYQDDPNEMVRVGDVINWYDLRIKELENDKERGSR